MKLECDDRGQVTVLRVKGELAGDGVGRFRDAVQQRLDAGQVHDVVLDFTDLQFIDSAGLEAMLWAQTCCGERLGQLRLAGCPEDVCTVLEMTRLAGQFHRHEDVDVAIRSLG
ncbi:MAG: STAS domain-containing protein [Phycisphaeraceae bacterium]